MRRIMVTTVALLGLAGMAGAQTVLPPGDPGPGKSTYGQRQADPPPAPIPANGEARPGHVPGVGDSFPASDNASNITRGDTRSVIAPRLPVPPGGPNGSAGAFLADAQRALNRGQTGLAQEALERAETVMLQRSVVASQADMPSQAPDVMQVKAARDALANRDIAGAKQAVAAAMAAGR